MGRGRTDAHAGTSRDEHALPTVDVDYAYEGLCGVHDRSLEVVGRARMLSKHEPRRG